MYCGVSQSKLSDSHGSHILLVLQVVFVHYKCTYPSDIASISKLSDLKKVNAVYLGRLSRWQHLEH